MLTVCHASVRTGLASSHHHVTPFLSVLQYTWRDMLSEAVSVVNVLSYSGVPKVLFHTACNVFARHVLNVLVISRTC